MNHDPLRPDPDALLADLLRADAQKRPGRLFIFLGMCPGVGKTYTMLRAARQRQLEGVDVLVGIVETHGRRETAELLEGLPFLPLRSMEHRGHNLREFDIDAALARKPQLVLVDELAHSNVPGSRHARRYQDVLELIGAGIDVYTTLNVQHIESQVDTVRQITGVTVSETVPDSILDRAHEIELVDLSVDKLLARLASGKVYMGERAELAATGFFKEANLTALREMALRFTAEHVDRDLEEIRRARRISTPWRTNARLLVGVGPSPYAESLIRWTRRSAMRLSCQWLVVWVEGSRPLARADQERLARSLNLARKLGGEVVSVTGDNVGKALLEVAQERNVTQIVVGKPNRRSLLRDLLTDYVVAHSGDIDVCMVRPILANSRLARTFRKPEAGEAPHQAREYGWTLGISAAIAAVGCAVFAEAGYVFVGLMFLLGIVFASMRFGRGPVLVMATVSALMWDFLFIEPYFTFHIHKWQDVIMFGMFFVVAMCMGHLTTRLREREQAEIRRQKQTAALLRVTQSAALATDPEAGLREALSTINELHRAETALFIRTSNTDRSLSPTPHGAGTFAPSAREWGVIHWVYEHRQAAGRFTDTLPESQATWFPLQTSTAVIGVLGLHLEEDAVLDFSSRVSVEACALQLALVLEKEQMVEAATRAHLLHQSERLQRTLLDSVSHELKTPLTVIQASVEGLASCPRAAESPQAEYLQELNTASMRLQRVVNNLLEMTRIEASVVKPAQEWCLLGDVLQEAVNIATTGDVRRRHPVRIDVPAELPAVQVDSHLLAQAVANVVHNASVYTPDGTPIEISARLPGGGGGAAADSKLVITIADGGPGIRPGDEDKIFEKFYRAEGSPAGGTGLGLSIARGLLRAQGGDITAGARRDGKAGAEFVITLQVSLLAEEEGKPVRAG
ncbi:two-component sensor histidine kinase [Verrucomicrobia bacterium LW23]|nr:two-component sensor histidine kinase [Verrucomicrobia bacterium LW23]